MQLPPEALDIYDQQGSIDCLPDGGFYLKIHTKKYLKKRKINDLLVIRIGVALVFNCSVF